MVSGKPDLLGVEIVSESHGLNPFLHSVSNSDHSDDVRSERNPEEGESLRPEAGDRSEAVSEEEDLRKLRARDAEVRSHEAAHLAAAGSLAGGGASFTLQTGPDGRIYAVGGEVSIDTSKGRTPEETIAKANQIRAAALAPAAPSGQDLKVAAAASRMESAAMQELQKENVETADPADGDGKIGNTEANSPTQVHSQNARHISNCSHCLNRFYSSAAG